MIKSTRTKLLQIPILTNFRESVTTGGESRNRYITAFFRNFNAGHRKRLVPVWLKAPGGQMFYWGELPRFSGQEPIDELVIHYREHYFDGRRVLLVTDRVVKAFGANELHHQDDPE